MYAVSDSVCVVHRCATPTVFHTYTIKLVLCTQMCAVLSVVTTVNNVYQPTGAAICACLTLVVSVVTLSYYDAFVLSMLVLALYTSVCC